MKKNGFTLAEVLITLSIIGVVATLTLPALMTNTAEQQAKTALKKGVNTLTEAAQMNQAIAGFDYSSMLVDTKEENAQSLYGLLASRTQVDFLKTGDKGGAKTKQPSFQGDSKDANSANYVVFFRDGSTLSFIPTETSTSATGAQNANVIQDDGLPYGIPVLFDTNGPKAPNILSNCESAATGVTDDDGQSDVNLEAYCTKATRVIKDQFGLRLRGGFVVPNGAAARWAFED